MLAEAVEEEGPKEEIPFHPGQVVEVMEGPFSDFSGTVEEVIPDKGKVLNQIAELFILCAPFRSLLTKSAFDSQGM